MADIKITQEMIDFYRSKLGNSVLLDSVIIDLIKKDIDSGKLPKEFVTLATDAQKTGFNTVNSNLFGYGFESLKINNSQNIEIKYEVKEDNIDLKTNNEYQGLFNSDKKISGIMQSCVGDCVLLAELISLSHNPIGKKYIENAINYDENGNIEIYFIGIDKTFTVPKKHLYNPLGVLGDIDASAIEKAVWLCIKKEQEENSKGEYDILDPDVSVGMPYTLKEKISNGLVYPELNNFTPGLLTFLLTGATPEESYKNIEDFLTSNNKGNNNILTLCINEPLSGKKWYTSIKELITGFCGELVSNHAFSVTNINSKDITLINPWLLGRECTFEIESINNSHKYDLCVIHTNNFLQKEENDEGNIIFKRRDGSVARIIEKNEQGQLIKIQTCDKSGAITACQEYKNGQKVQLTYYYNHADSYKAEKEGQIEADWKSFAENKRVYYFENNKAIKVEIYYEDGSMEEKTENI